MEKSTTGVLAVLLCLAVFVSLFPLPSLGQELVVVENDWPPYYFGNSDEEHMPGFAREILDICIPQAGYRVTYEFYPVKRMYAYLEKGRIDIAIFSYKKQREETLMYGREPLFTSGYRPVVRQGSDIVIHSLDDFDSLRVGHLVGLKYSPEFYEYIKDRQKAGTLVTTTEGDSSLRMLLEGIIDVFVDTRDTVLWRAKKMGVAERIKVIDYDIKTSEYFVTLSRRSSRVSDPVALLSGIDTCIASLKSSGVYAEIAKRYGIQ